MTTRGVFGFKKDNKLKVSYIRFDAYIDSFGEDAFSFIQNIGSVFFLEKIFSKIELLDETTSGTDELDLVYEQFNNMSLFNFFVKNNPVKMLDDKEFLMDSLFCEYGYIVDLDEKVFVILNQELSINEYENVAYSEVPTVAKIPLGDIFSREYKTLTSIINERIVKKEGPGE